MNPYTQLSIAALLPVVASVILYLINKHTPFKKLPYMVRQVIFGLIFGGIAIFGTEYGVAVAGVTMNVRDAAPICAGLIFGAPAGVISGLIGGVERFLAASWGKGEYTMVACSVATAVAGVFSGWLHKYMFENKKPTWIYGLATGAIMEVLHMLMVLLTHLNDVRTALGIVQKCAIPMIFFSACSVMLAIVCVSLVSGEPLFKKREQVKISQSFQRALLISVVVAFIVTSLFSATLQTGVTKSQTENFLKLNIQDVEKQIAEASNQNLLRIAKNAAQSYEALHVRKPNTDMLEEICRSLDISELNVIDRDGIIIATTNPDFMDYDMKSGPQSAAFLQLLDHRTHELVQEYGPVSYDGSIFRKYAGIALEGGGFLQVGYDAEHFQKDIYEKVIEAVKNRHIGETGYLIVCDADFTVVSDKRVGKASMQNEAMVNLSIPEDTVYEATAWGEECFCMYAMAEGYYIVGAYPKTEANFVRDISIYITVFMEVLIFTALFILIYFLIKRLIVDKIRRINRSLGKITNGDLDEAVDVRSNEEFASLSDDINSTVATLKRYIDEAAARIDKELEFAKTIQTSVLPRVFPPFPDRREFDIWAGMKTAKEVGGDFYDFYMPDENRIVFLIADVSGKGIPAAMFMMTAKTMLKSMVVGGAGAAEAFTKANEELCANNDAGMFVTAWMGILDLKTGVVKYVNAGHNPPLVRHANGDFEYLRSRAGFVLAGMEGISYRENEMTLLPGDTVYLYTDGVTEATDKDKALYGEERLISRLNAVKEEDAEGICRAVKADVDAFVGEEPQFDDITMLCLSFKKRMGEEQ